MVLLTVLAVTGTGRQVLAQQGLRVYISVDMEGVAGVTASDQVTAGGGDYQMARMWTTQEANAAIQGALDAGATYIVVNDSHGGMRNILAHELNPAARLITGTPKPLGMMQGIDETFDAAIFIGYHSRAGSANGILDHTYSGASVYSLKINGLEVGESELNALIAAQFGVPVVMIAGDRAVCEQVKGLLGEQVVTVEVKEGIGRFAANTLVPSEAQRRIRENTRLALERRAAIQPFHLEGPYHFEVNFLNSAQAEAAELVPGVGRAAPRTVTYSQEDFIEGFRLFRALLSLARP
jgi:D-amino peptidase